MHAYRAQSFWIAAIVIVALFFIALSPTIALGANETITPTCTGLANYYNPWCWVQTLVQALGTMAISLSGLILTIAATLFDTLLSLTILQFGSYYDQYFKQGVELAWSTFRDVTNIVIIGSFVFVAISTILQSQNYGYRQFVARLIIAAVLINFSLFFCKISIDISHIFAQQFLKGISSSATVNTDQPAQTNVAGEFMKASGISSVFDSWSVIKKVSEKSQSNTVALIYAVLTSAFFLALAIIFLYGSALLLVRIIVLTLLMLVSALAFGAMAVPGLQSWWTRWKKEFLKNVFFAPLLFMFLWATITIARRFAGTGSLADLAANPNSSANVAALISYLIVIGLLFAALHLSKSLSITTGVGYMPSLKSWQNVLTPLSKAADSLKNVWRYQQSKRAQKEEGSEATAQKATRLNNLMNLDKQGLLKDRKDRKEMAALQRGLNAQRAKASGNFNFLKNSMLPGMAGLNKGIDTLNKAGKILSEGAGKGGYEKIAKDIADREKKNAEWIDKKVSEAYKSNLPNEADQRAAYDKEVASRVTVAREDGSRIAALERQKEQHKEQLAAIERIVNAGTTTKEDTEERQRLKSIIQEVDSRIDRARKFESEGEEAIAKEVFDELTQANKALKKELTQTPEKIGGELKALFEKAATKNQTLRNIQVAGPGGKVDTYNEQVYRSKREAERKKEARKQRIRENREVEKEDMGEEDKKGSDTPAAKTSGSDSGGNKK